MICFDIPPFYSNFVAKYAIIQNETDKILFCHCHGIGYSGYNIVQQRES